MIDELEPRRMLVIFSGTDNADEMHIYSAGGALHVWINDVEHVTTEAAVSIFANGGNDVVYIEKIVGFSLTSAHRLSISLGAGDDYITNYIPQDNRGTLAGFTVKNFDIDGGSGNDTIGIDDTVGAAVGYTFDTRARFADPSVPYFDYQLSVSGQPSGAWAYTSFEQLTLDQGPGQATTTLRKKSPQTKLTVNSREGDDLVRAGGFQLLPSLALLPANGWALGTTTVTSGGGHDRFEMYSEGGSPNDVVVSGSTVAQSGQGFSHFGFEELAIGMTNAAVTVNGPSGSVELLEIKVSQSTVNLWAVSTTTTVSGERCTVNVGAGSLATLGGKVDLLLGNLASATEIVNILDYSSHAGYTYLFEKGKLTRNPGQVGAIAIGISGGDRLNLNLSTGAGNDYINVAGAAAGTSINASGNHGDDSLYIGGGYLANVLGPVTLDGGPGNDNVRFDNGGGTAFTDVVLTAATFAAAGGPTHTYAGAEFLSLIHGGGGARTDIRSLAVPLSATGSSGDDVILVGGGDLDANFAPGATVFFDGYPGEDRIEYDDRLDVNDPLNPGDYTLDARLTQLFGDVFLRYDRLRRRSATVETWRVEQRILHASDDPNVINVLDAGAGLRINANGGDDQVNVAAAPAATPVIVHTGDGADGLAVNIGGNPPDLPATVLLEHSDELNSINVQVGGTLRVGPGAVLTKRGGAFGFQGVIDLAGGTMIIQGAAAQLATMNGYVKAGYNGGLWNGTSSQAPDGTAMGAIQSSLAASSPLGDAVGLARASDVLGAFPATFAGVPVGASDLLLRHTLYGDANLDRSINFTDLVAVAQNYNATGATWARGDSNFDASVTFADLVPLAQNYNALPPTVAATPVSTRQRSSMQFNASAPVRRPVPQPVARERELRRALRTV
jgi:hypothetical protein